MFLEIGLNIEIKGKSMILSKINITRVTKTNAAIPPLSEL